MSTAETFSVGDCSPEQVLNRVDEAICGLDDELRITFVNRQAATLLEQPPEDLLETDIWEVVPDGSEVDIGERLRRATETQRATEFETQSPETDRWLKVRLYPAEDGITACFSDITDKHTERGDGERQRRLFERIFEETQDALVVTDADRRITKFNPAAERLFGYSADDVIGEQTRLLYSDAEQSDQQEARQFEKQKSDANHNSTVIYERADGTTFDGETLRTELGDRDNRTAGFLASIRDVSSSLSYQSEITSHIDALQTLHGITTDESQTTDEQIDALLQLGTDHLGVETGILSSIEDESCTVKHISTSDRRITPGDRYALDHSFCRDVIDVDELIAISNAGDSNMSSHPAYQEHATDTYIGVAVLVDGDRYGTLNFSQSSPRGRRFTESERTFVCILAEWIGKELSRRQSRDRAAANRERLRQIIDLMPQLVFAKDKINEFILANQATADAYGTAVEEIEGSTDADFASEAEAEQFRQDDLAVIESGEPKHIPEEPLTMADGETVILETIKIPYDPVDHDTEAVLGVATDITERKQRERQLEGTTQRLNVALKGTNTGVWEWDLETDEVIWTESMDRLMGVEFESFKVPFDAVTEYIHSDDLPHVERELQQAVDTDGTLQVEYRVQQEDGTQFWVEARGELVDRTDGSRRMVGIITDISDRKQREAELELQSAAMEVAMDGIAILDGDEYVYMNQAHADIFEYDAEELLGSEWRRLYDRSEIDRIETEVFPIIAEQGGWRGETVGRKQDGSPVTQDIGLSLLDSGELICTNRDISEQKQLESELRLSNQSLRELTEIGSDPDRELEAKISTLLELGCDRLDLPYGFVNLIADGEQRTITAVGDHPEIQRGKSSPLDESYCQKTINQGGTLELQDAIAAGWSDEPAYDRFELRCYIGEEIVTDGELYGTLCFAGTDSRERAFTEAERSFFELLVQWISYELTSNRFETRLQEINETAQQLMNAPSKAEVAAITTESIDSVLGMPITGIWWKDEDCEALVPGRQTEDAAEIVGEQPAFEQGNSLAWDAFKADTVRYVDELHGADGRYEDGTTLRSEVIVPLDHHGVLIASSTVPAAFSETDRNLLELLSATVESALSRADRETTLRTTQQQLKQSNEELEQFAYAASHDLQEPLRTVSSYLTLLERRYGDEFDGDAAEFIEFAVDGADRMRSMIQALLAYSRVDTRREAFESVELSTIFEQVTDNLGRKIAESSATVTTPEANQTVAGDTDQLCQLFQNLVENGIKYNTDRPEIDISVTRSDERVRIDVTDNGIGIDPNQTEDIFQVFQRLHTREEFDGTGIGLSICRKIVDRHDGEIRVDSEPGTGSTFTVLLPTEGDDD